MPFGADPVDPAIASAEIASEFRRSAGYVWVTIALTIVTTDMADALAIAWDAFRCAARDDPQAGRCPPPRRRSSRSRWPR
jgi:hypothetical protein